MLEFDSPACTRYVITLTSLLYAARSRAASASFDFLQPYSENFRVSEEGKSERCHYARKTQCYYSKRPSLAVIKRNIQSSESVDVGRNLLEGGHLSNPALADDRPEACHTGGCS
jgi:hypothetical protein